MGSGYEHFHPKFAKLATLIFNRNIIISVKIEFSLRLIVQKDPILENSGEGESVSHLIPSSRISEKQGG